MRLRLSIIVLGIVLGLALRWVFGNAGDEPSQSPPSKTPRVAPAEESITLSNCLDRTTA
jgi:hypothetical protein